MLALADEVLKKMSRLDAKGRYWLLHIVVNGYVVWKHGRDVVACYTDPINSAFSEEPDMDPLAAVVSLHLLHALRYKLDRVDWLHHITMIGLLGPIAACCKGGHLLGHGLFYMSGLPGMISYINLLLVRLRVMTPARERASNAALNLWVRGPGLTWHALLSFIAFLETCKSRRIKGSLVPTSLQPGIAVVMALGSLWNGQFFLGRIIRSAERLRLA